MSCFTHKYPYTSNRELNLDWLIAKINARKILNLEVIENVGGGYDLVIYFADSDPVTVHLFAATEITAEDIYDLFEDSETITKALNDGKISFSAESNIYPVIYGQTSYADASAALTAGKQLIAFYLENNKYIQIPFKTKNVDTMNFSTVIDDIENGKIVIRLALNRFTGWDSRIQSLLIGDDLLNIIDDTETIVADLNENDHLELSASYENILHPLARSLKTPVSEPAEKKIVGFDENRDQMNLGIGNGLKIENDDLKINEEELPKQTPLTVADNLPVANATEYNKHLLYLNLNKLKYITKTSQYEMIALPQKRLQDTYYNDFDAHPLKIGNIIYYCSNDTNSMVEYDILNNTSQKYNLSSQIFPYAHEYLMFKKDDNNILIAITTSGNKLRIVNYNVISKTGTIIFNGASYHTDRALAKYNNYIYTFGGYSGETGANKITKYDIINNTETVLGATLQYKDEKAVAVTIGTKIYIFGGELNPNKLQIFDCVTETLTSISLQHQINTPATAINKNGRLLLLFGKIDNVASNKIYELNVETGELDEIYTYNSTYTNSFECHDDDYIYLMFGFIGGSSSVNTELFRIGTNDSYSYKTLATET